MEVIQCKVFPYLKGFYNKVVIFYMVSYILCGDCIQIYLDLLWYFVFRYLVLNKWYQSTFLGQTLWENIFYFCRFFFRSRKKRAATFSNFLVYLCVKFAENGCISEFLSEKTQFGKKKHLKRSPGSQDIEVLKSVNF